MDAVPDSLLAMPQRIREMRAMLVLFRYEISSIDSLCTSMPGESTGRVFEVKHEGVWGRSSVIIWIGHGERRDRRAGSALKELGWVKA